MHTTEIPLLQITQALRFFFLNVLPVAFGQIFYRVRDWQVLILGLIALFLAWRWSKTVERRAERIAREILNRAVRLQVEKRQEEGNIVGIDVLKRELQVFRKCVRNILSETPVSDEAVPPEVETRYQELAGFSFSKFGASTDLGPETSNLLTTLEDGIINLREGDSINCRELWRHLVELNASARTIEESITMGAGIQT